MILESKDSDLFLSSVETLIVCKESIKVYTPPEMLDAAYDRYRFGNISTFSPNILRNKADPDRYLYKGLVLAEAALNLPNLKFYRLNKGKLEKIIDSDYGEKNAHVLYYGRGRDRSDTIIYCHKKALSFVNRFNPDVIIDPDIIQSRPLQKFQQLLNKIRKDQDSYDVPVLPTAEYEKYIDAIWPPDSYEFDQTEFSKELKKTFLNLFQKTNSPK
jgi:hypothetical protein